MMKHGLLMPALLCWAATAAFAVQGSPGSPQELSLQELEAVEGGDLYLAVDRNRQMMTVTQVTPGQYYGSQSYSVKVTTSVVRNQDVTSQNVKGDMTNAERKVGTTATNKSGEKLYQLSMQYPSGTHNLSPTVTTLPNIPGPAIRTSASQRVPVVNSGGTLMGSVMDYGYYIHYTNPLVATNTLGCIGVQSLASMNRVAETLKTDTASYTDPSQAKQTVTVTSYTNNTPPSASAFTPAGSPPASPGASPKPSSPAPAAKAPVAPLPVAKAAPVTTPVSAPAPAPLSVPVVKAPPTTRTVKLKDL